MFLVKNGVSPVIVYNQGYTIVSFYFCSDFVDNIIEALHTAVSVKNKTNNN